MGEAHPRDSGHPGDSMNEAWRFRLTFDAPNGVQWFMEFSVDREGKGWLQLLTTQGPHAPYPIGSRLPVTAVQAGLISSVADVLEKRILQDSPPGGLHNPDVGLPN